jgi:hypothetical protein
MIWRHGKCGYKPLQDHACPSKIKANDAQLDSTVILVRILLALALALCLVYSDRDS